MLKTALISTLALLLMSAATTKRKSLADKDLDSGKNATPTQESPSQLGPDEKEEYKAIYTTRLENMRLHLVQIKKQGAAKQKTDESEQKISAASQTLTAFMKSPQNNWYSEENALEVAFDNADKALDAAYASTSH